MMDEDLPSAQIPTQIKTEDDITSLDFLDGYLKSEKDILTIKSEVIHSDIYTAQVKVKSDEDVLSWSLGDIKEESLDLGLRIKKEELDNIPAGLIPPIEMEEEFEITRNTHASLNKTPNKIKTVSKENCSCKQYKIRKSLKGKSDTSSKTIGWSIEPTEPTGHIVPIKINSVVSQGRKGLIGPEKTGKGGKSNKEDVFSCETCGKVFDQLALYTDHVKIHRRQKPYTCDQCEMKFAKPSYLKIHLRRHAGDRPFPCDLCEKRFFDVYDLRVHQRVHTGERPYLCSECGKGFKRIYTLNKHKQTHSNEKPFQCTMCGKAYKYGYSYRLHMKDHLD